MCNFQHYEEYLNSEVFGDTSGVIEIKSKSELLDYSWVNQEYIREVFQTGMKAVSLKEQIYYFPIICKLKVVAILFLQPKKNAEKKFKAEMHFLQKAAELGSKWVGENFEHEHVKRKSELTNAEMVKLFSSISEPLCLISSEGIIQEINTNMASLIQKGSPVLKGERVLRLFTEDMWELIKRKTRREETMLKIHHRQEEFLAVIQPVSIKKEILSYLILFQSKKDLSKGHESRGFYTFADIKGISQSLKTAINAASRVAAGDATIMLRGESGTGKEMFAQSIHQKSSRDQHPFIAINCAAIPENLLESELFGYEKGAFTGAEKSKPGRFELANGGTIFLDEIGDMPLYLQAKILRVIQEKTIERVGSSKSIEIDVRVITATHQNLEQLVQEGKFREDLYYRISVIPINIPPLRERKEDLPILIEHYMRDLSQSMNRPTKRLSEEVIKWLLDYQWPGNIRELHNVIRRFVELEAGDTITIKSLPDSFLKLSQHETNENVDQKPKLFDPSHKQQKNEILLLLDQYGRDTEGKKRIAKELGISLATLYRKLKKFNLN